MRDDVTFYVILARHRHLRTVRTSPSYYFFPKRKIVFLEAAARKTASNSKKAFTANLIYINQTLVEFSFLERKIIACREERQKKIFFLMRFDVYLNKT